MFTSPSWYRPTRPVTRPPAENGHLAIAGETDAAAVEEDGHVGGGLRAGGEAVVTEGEEALILQEEVALLGEEEAEAGQVHLLLVGLDLREVGVVGEVGRQVLR